MILTSKNIIVLKETDSTNNYAKQLIVDKAEEGTVVLARYQKEGKGQQGNFWESEAQKNLLCSIILYPRFLAAGKQFYISKIVSIALFNVLQRKVSEVSVKWPNDIYVGTKKIAGILIENTIKGSTLDSSIIGIGLNLNQTKFISNAPNPVSLKQLSKQNYVVEDVLSEFVNEFNGLLMQLKAGKYNAIEKLYLSVLFRNREWWTYRTSEKEFEARIIGIGDFGQLHLEDRRGEINEFMFKEVEFVI